MTSPRIATAVMLAVLTVACGGPGEPETAAPAGPQGSPASAPASAPGATAGGDAYVAEVEAWRADREQRLRSEDGWLSLVGLYWLEPGANTFGSAADNTIVLPEGAAPAHAGRLVLDGASVRLEPAADAEITIDGEKTGERALDASGGQSAEMHLGRLRLLVLSRGDRYALRVKDPESPTRRDFTGIEAYPVDPAWRVEAVLRPYEAPKPIEIQTVVGTTIRQWIPGVLEFTVEGKSLTLLPLVDEPGQTSLFLSFRDETSGTETYGAGRYLYADLVDDGAVLDFNEAYNPPCAFTPYATCPLPPAENTLPIAVRAGEKAPPGH